MPTVEEVMEDRVLDRFSGSFGESIPAAETGDALPPGFAFCAPTAEPLPAAEPADRISEALRQRIGEERYDLWFERKTRLALAGNALVVEAPNAFAARWIGGKFQQELAGAAREVLGRDVEILIRAQPQTPGSPWPHGSAQSGEAPAAALAGRQRTSPPAASAASSLPPINPRHALEDFVVGPSNQLAYHAACRVAAAPGREFSPLFIHGACGLGKTHLLQGICLRFASLHPGKKWLYLTGEQFTNEFIESVRTHRTDSFRRRMRQAELLVIDDVHFLSSKKATQEEFLHTFNQVDACGKQVVLASDCAPRQIQALSEQLSSRFVSGMVLRVDSPDLPTRLEILRRRVARNGWNIADAVLMHIARSAASSVRELEGLLLQVVAGIRLINSGAPDAGAVLANIKERTAMRGPVPVERITAAVSEHLGVTTEAMLGSGREKRVCVARAMSMYLARQHTGMSYPEIGRAIGRKNHSTVIAACQRIEAMISGNEVLCWCTPAGPRHQAVCDILRELESAIRRCK